MDSSPMGMKMRWW